MVIEKEPQVFTVSQKAIIMPRKNEILMMEKAGKKHWDLPGGKLDRDEDMEAGLRREIREETGLDAKIGRVVHVGHRSFDEADKLDRIMIFYRCETPQKLEKIKLSDEHSQWRIFTPQDLKNEKKYEINPVVRAALKKAFA